MLPRPTGRSPDRVGRSRHASRESNPRSVVPVRPIATDALPCVAVVVVNYRSAQPILDGLRAWREERRGAAHRLASIAIVDNDPGELDDLETAADVHYIRLDGNYGYAKAVDQGWRATHEPYALLLGPDARISLTDIDTLASVLDTAPDVGAVAPLHINSNDQVTNPYHTLPSWIDLIAHRTRVYRFAWAKQRVATYFMRELDGIGSDWPLTEVPQPPASCLMLRRTAVREDDPIDERFPFLFSDVDLSRHLAAGGWRTLVVPAARCWHVPATSGRYLGLRNRAENHIGAYRYARKWEPRLGAELFRAALLGELALTARGAPDVRLAMWALILNRSVFDRAVPGDDPVRRYWPSANESTPD